VEGLAQADVALAAINAICNTVQVIALAYIGAMVSRPRPADRGQG
jgi:hypothetical protein